jgi:hypothetical protein
MRLLKWHYQPSGRQTSHSWYDSIVEQRRELGLVLDDSTTLRNQVPELLAKGYARGRRKASHDTGLPLTTFPEGCLWTPEQILDDDFWPEEQAETDWPTRAPGGSEDLPMRAMEPY